MDKKRKEVYIATTNKNGIILLLYSLIHSPFIGRQGSVFFEKQIEKEGG